MAASWPQAASWGRNTDRSRFELHPVDLEHGHLVRRAELDRILERSSPCAPSARGTRSGVRPRPGSARRHSCPASTRRPGRPARCRCRRRGSAASPARPRSAALCPLADSSRGCRRSALRIVASTSSVSRTPSSLSTVIRPGSDPRCECRPTAFAARLRAAFLTPRRLVASTTLLRPNTDETPIRGGPPFMNTFKTGCLRSPAPPTVTFRHRRMVSSRNSFLRRSLRAVLVAPRATKLLRHATVVTFLNLSPGSTPDGWEAHRRPTTRATKVAIKPPGGTPYRTRGRSRPARRSRREVWNPPRVPRSIRTLQGSTVNQTRVRSGRRTASCRLTRISGKSNSLSLSISSSRLLCRSSCRR